MLDALCLTLLLLFFHSLHVTPTPSLLTRHCYCFILVRRCCSFAPCLMLLVFHYLLNTITLLSLLDVVAPLSLFNVANPFVLAQHCCSFVPHSMLLIFHSLFDTIVLLSLLNVVHLSLLDVAVPLYLFNIVGPLPLLVWRCYFFRSLFEVFPPLFLLNFATLLSLFDIVVLSFLVRHYCSFIPCLMLLYFCLCSTLLFLCPCWTLLLHSLLNIVILPFVVQHLVLLSLLDVVAPMPLFNVATPPLLA